MSARPSVCAHDPTRGRPAVLAPVDRHWPTVETFGVKVSTVGQRCMCGLQQVGVGLEAAQDAAVGLGVGAGMHDPVEVDRVNVTGDALDRYVRVQGGPTAGSAEDVDRFLRPLAD